MNMKIINEHEQPNGDTNRNEDENMTKLTNKKKYKEEKLGKTIQIKIKT